jgi:hypothetical protein
MGCILQKHLCGGRSGGPLGFKEKIMGTSRLYLHIGTHKTGTTAIQHALSQNNALLQKEGFAYLPTPKEFKLLSTIKKLDNELISTCRTELKRRVKHLNRRYVNLRFLMSWEGFSGDPLSGYRNAGIVAEHLRQITENFDVYIIVYLRAQDDFVESLYTQYIHIGESYSFQQFVKTYPVSSFNWERLLRCYSERFGKEKIIVRIYDKAFLPEKDSLLRDFAHIVGIRSSSLHTGVVTLNLGYSRDAIEIARLINPYLNSDEKVHFRRILQSTWTKHPFERYSFWNSKERKEFLALYSKSNAIVAKEYFNEPSGVLFPSSGTCNEDHVYQGLSLEAVTMVLAKAIIFKQTETKSKLISAVEKAERKVIGLLNHRFPWLYSKLKNLGRKLGLL